MIALLTGATGFVGGHITKRLLTRGDDVHVLLRENSKVTPVLFGTKIHRIEKNLTNLQEVIEKTKPDVIFHIAARFQDEHQCSEIPDLIESNVTFGTVLIDAAIRAGCQRMINTGTSWQHSGKMQDRDLCFYAATKTALEVFIKYFCEFGQISIITLKLFDTYGPVDGRRKIIALMKKCAETQSELGMSPGQQLLNLVYIDDVVDCFLLAADRLTGNDFLGVENYAVSSDELISLQDLATLFSRVSGCPLPIKWGARAYRQREVMVPWSGGRPLPGWSPRIGLEEGLRATLQNV